MLNKSKKDLFLLVTAPAGAGAPRISG